MPARPLLILVLLLASAAGLTAQPLTRATILDRAFVTAQGAGITAASRALAQSATRIAAGRADLAALLRQRQDSARTLADLTDALGRAASGVGAGAEAAQRDLAAQIDSARLDLASLDDRIGAEFPEFRELTDPAPLSVTEVQAVLDPGEALLFTLTDQGYTYVWAISKTGADWHRAEIDAGVRESRVRHLRAALAPAGEERAGIALRPGALAPRAAPFPRRIAQDIYAELFAPLEPVFGTADHVMAVLDGPLSSLPLSLLVTAPPEGGDADPQALRDTPWLVKRHALTTLPNVSALRVLRFARGRNAPQGQRAPFVGFGDPRLGYRLSQGDGTAAETVVTRGTYADLTRVADLAPLPATARELRALAAVTGAGPDALFLGEDATETRVKSADLSGTDIVAFATHGLLADGLPGLAEPALVFTPPATPTLLDDALLTASEAAQLKLSARLVILSACDTAGPDGTPGAEGLSGLARAFLYAGARAILVSHWPVDDRAAAALTTGMIAAMGQDRRTRAKALRRAMLDVMQDPANPRFAHPRLWAPFVVVGEGGADG